MKNTIRFIKAEIAFIKKIAQKSCQAMIGVNNRGR